MTFAKSLRMSSQSHELATRRSAALSAPAALSASATSTPPHDNDESDPRHRVRAARARLMNRLHELERRVKQTKDTFNLANHIRTQPVAAVGVSLVLGATVGFLRGDRAQSTWAIKLFAMVSRVAMDVAKSQLRGWASQQLGGGLNASATADAARSVAANASASASETS